MAARLHQLDGSRNPRLRKNYVEISWPATRTNLALELTPDLAAGGWTPVPEPWSVVNDQCVVTNSIDPGNRFYRLRGRP